MSSNFKFTLFNKASKTFEHSDQMYDCSQIHSYDDILKLFFETYKTMLIRENTTILEILLYNQISGVQNLKELLENEHCHLKSILNSVKIEIIQVNIVYKSDSSMLKEKSLVSKDYFNRRLIKSNCKDFFDCFYTKKFECGLCKDVLFDPVLCNKCRVVYCRNCVYDVCLAYKSYNVVKCKHEEITEVFDLNLNLSSKTLSSLVSGGSIGISGSSCSLIASIQEDLDKIKVECYFRCNTEKLSLLNYSAHIRCCNHNYDLFHNKKELPVLEKSSSKTVDYSFMINPPIKETKIRCQGKTQKKRTANSFLSFSAP